MDKRIKKPAAAHESERISLGALIHQHVRLAIETAVHEELRAALGTTPYERSDVRRGYRNGMKARTLTGPTGPVALMLPRATLFGAAPPKGQFIELVPAVPGAARWEVELELPTGARLRLRG